MLYISFIIFCVVLIAVLNAIFTAPVYNESVWLIILYTVISVVGVIAIDGIFATIVRWAFPKKWFGVDKNGFSAGKKECRFYEKLGIKKWKDLILELGMFTSFSKSKISDPTNNEFVERYILEANYGIGVHIACDIFGFLVCLIFPRYWYCIGIPVAIVNLFLNTLSILILRYNLPKLHTLYRINQKREKRKAIVEEQQSKTA